MILRLFRSYRMGKFTWGIYTILIISIWRISLIIGEKNYAMSLLN